MKNNKPRLNLKVIGLPLVWLETQIDRIRYGLKERGNAWKSPMIQAYRGFGTPEKAFIKGRVLEDKAIQSAKNEHSVWQTLQNMYRRFESDEIPHARLKAHYLGNEINLECDEEGYFSAWIETGSRSMTRQLWQSIHLELIYPIVKNGNTVRAQGQVLIPPKEARFGVISDIDDTLIQSYISNPFRMALTLLSKNARQRRPFQDVGEFYRALMVGANGIPLNPIFYISSSPWNLYDHFDEIIRGLNIGLDPVIVLRDYGVSREEIYASITRDHKDYYIKLLLDLYPQLPFILIGDSGQQDPEIYTDIALAYPGRILSIYLRDVSHKDSRRRAIERLNAQLKETCTTEILLTEDTQIMAQHAAGRRWINPEIINTAYL
jgi:phosphatidate phosphatase APP1